MQQARSRIIRAANQNLDLVSFWKEASAALARVVPHYLSPCWFTLDPTTLLVTSHYQAEIPELPPEWLAHEYFTDDFHKIADIARSDRGISTLHEATGGDPSRSIAWNQYMRPFGADQELLLALRTRAGHRWGLLGLYREPDSPLFTSEEMHFLREMAPVLAEGARRGLIIGEATDPEGPEAPGLVILTGNWSVESVTPGTERWLAELPDGDWARGKLPPSVLAVAGRASHLAGGADVPGEVAFARVLSRSGLWIVLHGAVLVGNGDRRIAVIIEPAHPARIMPLLMNTYGLTEREQDITGLILQGYSTTEIASAIVVSAHTVQQHLKNIFDKTGVRSRRELVGQVFFSYYEPRLRDNERRSVTGKPLRGGPMKQSHRHVR
ncbi:MAG: helix-turn-helix transcriptional regulator [Chloroflexi bacterium]|nr:helix-turn-helix transcriptional regulator [Chloroflexota bacterium]